MSVSLARELVHGRWKAEALAVTLRLGIADALGDGVVSVPELAARVDASEDGLRRLLRVMVALGVFSEAGGDGYRNNDASDLLRADHPRSLRDYALGTLSASPPGGSRIE